MKVLIIGWSDIMDAIGLESKARKHKALVVKLNAERGGPIKRMTKKRVSAEKAALLSWWKTVREGPDSTFTAREADRNQREEQGNFENAGVRKDLGFHSKTSPNKLRRDP